MGLQLIDIGAAVDDHSGEDLRDGGASMRAQAGPGQTALAIAAFPDAATMHVVDGQVVLR